MPEVALPVWTQDATEEELSALIDEFDHNVVPVVGRRGWLCSVNGCETQVQQWGDTWWHVPELIAYALLTGMVEVQTQSEREREREAARVMVLGPRPKPELVSVTHDGLTTQERIDQTLAMWESYGGWGD